MTATPTRLAPVVRCGGPLADPPLSGVTIGRPEAPDLSALVAAGLLEQLGATVVEATGLPIARLVGEVPDGIAGLPPGTVPYACGIATAAAAVLAHISDADVEVDGREIAVQVLLPAVLAAEYGTRHREPPPPRRIGDGALACDLATDDDEAAFARLLEVLGPEASARTIADEAQIWRLPVCEYVRRDDTDRAPHDSGATTTVTGSTAGTARGRATGGCPPLDGITVCDLTAMWAGPLSTWLLAGAGATVHKIEPRVRIDGMRGLDGGGIHPPDVDPATGSASAMFNALNRQKTCHDLDLRDPDDRAAFFALVATSDLVVDSFSRRVMPNLGLSPEALRAAHPGIATLSIPAFPEGHAWQVALGPAVHAATGLGDLGAGRFATPTVAYPDPLAGLTAFVVATALIVGARRGLRSEHAEVTLFDATTPLTRIAPPEPIPQADAPLQAREPEIGRRLLDEPALASAWEPVDDGAGRHRYPRHPFRGAWTPVTAAPAPALGSAGRR
ncbi:MAG: CoA transferase [Ilumatobacteraceae bacterium]